MGKLQDYLRDQAAEYPYVRGLYDAADLLDECEKVLRGFAEFAKHFPLDGSRGALRPKRGEIYMVNSMIDGKECSATLMVEDVNAAAALLAKLEGGK